MDGKAHWDSIYATRPAQEVSWYRPRLDTSLELIQRVGLAATAEIVDIGGGASTLIDDLLRMGFQNISVLDLSPVALQKTKDRLGASSDRVRWMETDITKANLPVDQFDLWHDRAVFHFLTEPKDRAAYVSAATRALKKGAFLVMGTFALDAPAKCSGLNVQRYAPEELAAQFPAFALLDSRLEHHQTPSAKTQNFTYVLMQKRDT